MSDIDTAITKAVRSDRRPDVLTEGGKAYLKLALDPYHDFNVNTVGIPTPGSGATYTRNIRLRESLVVPALDPGVSAWELHVMTTPVYCAQAAAQLNTALNGAGTIPNPYRAKNTVNPVGPVDQMSHVCYAWVPVNSPLGILDPATKFRALPLGFPDWGSYRVVASGFEVHNSTPELYRSGTVTTWRANPVTEVSNLYLADQFALALARFSNGIPATLALANQFATSRTWEAASGCYVVSQPDFSDMAFKSYDEGVVVIKTGAATGSTRHSLIVGGFCDLDAGPGESRLVFRSGMVPSGAIFSSIAPESTFTLDCRVVVEVSPDLTSNDLSIASQPTPSDPAALELAALAFQNLPSGVPASFNAAGDWFRMVLSSIKTVAPLVAGIVPHPVAKAVATAVGTAAGAGSAILDARQRVLDSGNAALSTIDRPLAPPPTAHRAPALRPAPRRTVPTSQARRHSEPRRRKA